MSYFRTYSLCLCYHTLSLLAAAQVATFDTGEITPSPWITNPIALHVACPVKPNTPTVCTLSGYEDLEGNLEFYIESLPTAGLLYETSPNYRADGVDPKYLPDPIGPHMLPFHVTDSLNRIVYIPPANMWAPEGHWASFTFLTKALLQLDNALVPELVSSMPAMVVLTNPAGAIAASTFDITGDNDGWSTSGNLEDLNEQATGLKHQAFNWGDLSHYILGVDEIQYLDFVTGFDRTRWFFEASQNAFCKPEVVAAYGGTLQFKIRSLYGNFTVLNSPLDWVTLECQSCDSGRGLRLVRFVDDDNWTGGNKLRWDGTETLVQLALAPIERWQRDPLNAAMNYTYASECEIASTLSGLSRLAILGDWTRGGEGIAIDDVAIIAAPPAEQPAFPVTCQKGCVCRHNSNLRRPTCC
mmetsp:Transcript_105205/g.166071  ORF Transcript_105205/g.166071 Transcript_105205/m.166071 type:complete len:412 (-) Transcript_105205:42-1277(-)